MSRKIYGLTLVRREYERALDLNDGSARVLFVSREMALRRGDEAGAVRLDRELARTVEIGKRIYSKLNNQKGGSK